MLALVMRVLITATLCAVGWWDVKERYWLVCVAFRYTDVVTVPSQSLQSCTSRKGSLLEHTLATGHLVDLTKSEVIDCHPYATTRCLLESWHIQRNPDALNREKGTLPEVYTALLE